MVKDNKRQKILLIALALMFALFAADNLSASEQFYTELPSTPYLYSSAESWNPYSWQDGYCNNTGMDFIVQIEPSACSPSVVRSDLLEEQDVPVMCRMSGMKINPLIQVPYIKSISASVENKSNIISSTTFVPPNAAINSYVSYDEYSSQLQGIPTMNNLGYLVVYLKQQPVESKIPENAIANMQLRIRYDVSGTYGIYGQQFVLRELSKDEWLQDYGNSGFWRDKGYLRLDEITGKDSAKISVYSNQNNLPLKTVELGVGEESNDEILLPGFYCGAGVKLRLDNVGLPENNARIEVNGNELVASDNDDLLDSGCKIYEINPGKYYGGSATIRCGSGQKPVTLTLTDLDAKIKVSGVEEKELTVMPASKISVNTTDGKEKRFYVGYIGKQVTKDYKFTDMIVLFTKKESQSEIGNDSVKKVTELVYDYIKSDRSAALTVGEKPESLLNEDINRFLQNKIKNDYHFYVLTSEVNRTMQNVKFELISATGPRQVYYTKETEDAYKEAVDYYRDVAFSYAKENHPEGTYYGIIALHNAAELASQMHKGADRLELLKDIISKYSDSDEPEIISEVESIRKELATVSAARGDNTATFSTSKGTYTFNLISVEPPGYGVKEAYIELDGVKGTYTVDSMIENYVLEEIDKDSITLRNITSNQKETLTNNNFIYINQKRVKLINTVLKEEVKVSVLPLDIERETLTNFTVQIGIEKRAIKLSPEQTKDAINKLNATISKLENARDNLGKIVSVWKKACLVGASALWIKNFATGLGGESLARKLVMESWTDRCSDVSYRKALMQEEGIKGDVISISRCYALRETEINSDLKVMKESLSKTNKFIDDVKATEGVVTKGGILGLSSVIDDEKFIEASQKKILENIKNSGILFFEVKRLGSLSDSERQNLGSAIVGITNLDGTKRNISISEWNTLTEKEKEKNRDVIFRTENKVSAETVVGNMILLSQQNRLLRSDVKDIYFDIELYNVCNNLNEAELAKSELCRQTILETYPKFSKYVEDIKNYNIKETLRKDLGVTPTIIPGKLQTIKTPVYNVKDYVTLPAEVSSQNAGGKFSYFFKDSSHYIAILEIIGEGKEFSIIKLYEIKKDGGEIIVFGSWTGNDLKSKLNELGISHIEEIDYSDCNNNKIERGPDAGEKKGIIKFWESGYYKGKIAYMPIEINSGFYMATTSYSGFEGAMVAWKESGDLNTFWICNVGKDKIPNFDFNSGPKGDDCCTQISIVTGASPQVPFLDEESSNALVKKVMSCSKEAIIEYSQGKRTISTDCGTFSLGKQPVAKPSAQCEDFMSPTDCRIMYNLCDPVMCPSSRCDYGGKIPVDNVVQSGIVGSVMLCLPNFEDGKGVLMPVCLTGLHAGLDSFTGILKSSRDCLQEQLNTGRTVGICDQITSVYMCEFLWRQFDPFIRSGLPAITESITNKGGGEYALFSESWKQNIEAAKYFTDYYALNSFQAFKARSTSEIGTEVCKKFASVAYPNQAKFFDELAKPESPTQATAWFDEIPMGGASFDSHYKVFFYIFAGRDQGVYYSVYLRRPAGVGYYERTIPEQYLVKDSFGYLSAGSYVSLTPDFTAPSGYTEICVRLNEKEICGFGKASTSFLVNELQNSYLQDQVEEEITTNKGCVSGTPSIIPTATLNIQSAVQNAVEPQIYKRGIIRICSTENPGKSTQPERWKYIGYCDNQNVGCWLDMNSVNASISDLGIRQEIANWSDEKDIKNAIDKLGLKKPEESQALLGEQEQKFVNLKNYVTDILNSYTSMFKTATNDEFGDEKIQYVKAISQYKYVDENYKSSLEGNYSVLGAIDVLKKNFENISEKAIRSTEKARAEIKIAELLDLKSRLLALPDVIGFEKEEEKKQEEETKVELKACSGEWLSEGDCNIREGVDLGNEFSDNQTGKICCEIIKFSLFEKWPVIETKEVHYFAGKKGFRLEWDAKKDADKNVFAVADGTVVLVDNELGQKWKYVLIYHGSNIYAYYGYLNNTAPDMQPGKKVLAGDVIGEANIIYAYTSNKVNNFILPKLGVYNPYALYFRVFTSKSDFASKDYEKAVNPLCFFDRTFEDSFKLFYSGEPEKWPTIDECSKILPKGVVITEKIKAEIEILRIGLVSAYFDAWPSADFNVASCYGYTLENGKKSFSDSIFIKSNKGSQVVSVADGVVEDVFNGCNEQSSQNCGITVIDSTDYGLFQINDREWKENLKANGFDWEKVKTEPEENIEAAAYIYASTLKQANGGFNQWATYNSNWGNQPYKNYLDKTSIYDNFIEEYFTADSSRTAKAIMWAESSAKPSEKGDNIRNNTGLGNVVVIKHSGNLYTVYTNLGSVSVNKGDKVVKRQKIGTAGCSGTCVEDGFGFMIYVSKDDLLRRDTGNHPLCFFSKNMREDLVSFTKNAQTNFKKYSENDIYGGCMPSVSYCSSVVLVTKAPENLSCSIFKNSEQCTEINGKCWWDSSGSVCRECGEQKCDGVRTGALGIGFLSANTPFKAEKDCEENNCNLACVWNMTSKKCADFDVDLFIAVMIANLNDLDERVNAGNIESVSDLDLAKAIIDANSSILKIEQTMKKENIILDDSQRQNFNDLLSEFGKKIKEIDAELEIRGSGSESQETQEQADVYIVSSVNNGVFNNQNKLVGFGDSVKLCAVLSTNSFNYYGDNATIQKAVIDSRQKDIKDVAELGQATIKWYEVKPIYAPIYDGAENRQLKHIYTLVAYTGQGKEHNDTIQYSQVALDKTGWCITLDKETGTYWYRAEITINGEVYSSLGKQASDDDFAGENALPDEYENYKETMLELNAYKYIDWVTGGKRYYLGINDEVHRISRKSNYAETICKDLGYASGSNSCNFISIIESYRKVPFAYGCSSYCFNNQCYETLTYNFMGIECLDLAVAGLKQININGEYSYRFNDFISQSTDIILDSQGHKIEKRTMNDIMGLNLGFATGGFSAFDKGHVNIIDVIFVYTNATSYTNTLILYDDTNRNKILDGDDKVIHASNKCPEDNQAYNGELCITPLKKFNVEGNYFTLARLKDL